MASPRNAFFVPGRLCLFGEHSDWAGRHRRTHPSLAPGACLTAGTDQGLWAEAVAAPGVLEITSSLRDGRVHGPLRIGSAPASLSRAAADGGFFSYVAGTAAEIRARFPVDGLSLVIRSDLPDRAGLSSSAAACVATARAYARAYGLALASAEEMEIAYAGERRAGSACGRMDPVCALGRDVHALHFDGDAWSVERVALGGDFHLLVVDLGRGKDTRRILDDLGACFPDTPGTRAARVREALGERNRALHRHARAALEAGGGGGGGGGGGEARAGLGGDVAPASPALDAPGLRALRAHPAVAELGWGAKGVGSQGDGCGQIVARGAAEREALAERLERALPVRCLRLTLSPTPSPPAPRPGAPRGEELSADGDAGAPDSAPRPGRGRR